MKPVETESHEQLLESREYERRARKAAVADVARLQEREAELLQRLAEYESGLRPTKLNTPGPQVSELESQEEENQILREELERFRAAERRHQVNVKLSSLEYGPEREREVLEVPMPLSIAESRGVLAVAAVINHLWWGLEMSIVPPESGESFGCDADSALFARACAVVAKFDGAYHSRNGNPEHLAGVWSDCENDYITALGVLEYGGVPGKDILCRIERRLDFLSDERAESRRRA